MMRRIFVFVVAAAGLVAAATTTAATPIPVTPDGGAPPGFPSPPAAASNGEAWAWTQLTSRGTQIRYVTTDTTDTCPAVRYTVAGSRNPFPMRRVSGPVTGFQTTVCERAVPLGASDAVLEQSTIHAATVHPANRQLPLPNWTATTRPRSIAVIGDTGCQVPVPGSPEALQNCQSGWPFQQIANSAATTPQLDLVIHVGDYLYREDPSRENDKPKNPGCTMLADSANWDCVVADFFRPAENLLARAPVALTRGNHEDCNQFHMGGAGGAWFRYLADDLRDNRSCSDYTNSRADQRGYPEPDLDGLCLRGRSANTRSRAG
ncbi:MAG: metallophosphoesterase [Pseudonocardiaceae bacterium]